MASPRPEFDPETVPWLDRYSYEIDAYVSRLPVEERPDYDLREKLLHWMRHGYVTFPGLVEADLIDAYLADIELLLNERDRAGVKFDIEGFGDHRARDFPPEAWDRHHFRIMDMHNASTAGKSLALHPRIVEFLRHVFRDTPVAMQTLTFIYGSEQDAHQDFAYVTAEIPSQLAATWIALQDVDPVAGPLFYHPGSHTVEKFDWGNGDLALSAQSTHTVPDFIGHLREQVASREYPREVFCPKKGDVFFWHSALVHGGSRATDPNRTRRSLVTHYSTAAGYTRDRRAPNETPLAYSMNGGFVFADPTNPDDEDRYRSTPLPEGTLADLLDLGTLALDPMVDSSSLGSFEGEEWDASSTSVVPVAAGAAPSANTLTGRTLGRVRRTMQRLRGPT
jgi:phytanoyl-CoA hydroxylase